METIIPDFDAISPGTRRGIMDSTEAYLEAGHAPLMEILLIALALIILLTVTPARSRGPSSMMRPASICKHVDIEELRRPWLRPPSRSIQKPTPPQSVPALEQDLVETVACENTRLIASTRNGVLFVRTETSPES